MNKRKSTPKLNRTHSHRKAMLSNMAVSLFEHERIVTTRAKGKALRSYAEPLITLARGQSVENSKRSSVTLHERRQLLQHLRSQKITQKLIEDIAPRFVDRPGGYLRIIHLPDRKSDASEMSIVELLERREKVKRVSSSKGGGKKQGGPGETSDATDHTDHMDQSSGKSKIKWYNRLPGRRGQRDS